MLKMCLCVSVCVQYLHLVILFHKGIIIRYCFPYIISKLVRLTNGLTLDKQFYPFPTNRPLFKIPPPSTVIKKKNVPFFEFVPESNRQRPLETDNFLYFHLHFNSKRENKLYPRIKENEYCFSLPDGASKTKFTISRLAHGVDRNSRSNPIQRI